MSDFPSAGLELVKHFNLDGIFLDKQVGILLIILLFVIICWLIRCFVTVASDFPMLSWSWSSTLTWLAFFGSRPFNHVPLNQYSSQWRVSQVWGECVWCSSGLIGGPKP